MDPATQGLLGAVTAQAILPARGGKHVWFAGLGAGMLPDADVILQPLSDPALPWELHRHFTHAYVMAPVMGLLAAGILFALPGFRRAWKLVIPAAIIGALTHAPLDLCTSYGTKVYWPFSMENATLDLFPIIDPLFTLFLLTCLIVAARRRSRTPAVVALVFVAVYAGTALVQRDAALDAQQKIAASRGHEPVRGRVMPMPASLLAWRSLYEVDGTMVADTVRPVPLGATRVAEGASLPIVTLEDFVADTTDPERVTSIFERFALFADGWTAYVRGDTSLVGDMRFGIDGRFSPPWAQRLGRAPDEPPIQWVQLGFGDADMSGLLAIILGTSEELRPLDP